MFFRKLYRRVRYLESKMESTDKNIIYLDNKTKEHDAKIERLYCLHERTALEVRSSTYMVKKCLDCGKVLEVYYTVLEFNKAQVKEAKRNLKLAKKQYKGSVEKARGETYPKNSG